MSGALQLGIAFETMLRRLLIFVTFFLAAGILVHAHGQTPAKTPGAQSSATKAASPKSPNSAHRRKLHKKVVETPEPPPPPPTPEQMPPVAPEVTYRGGMLSINAPNSTMADVLSAIRRVTGANIDRPPTGGSERIVARLGPGTPNAVLTQLLQGSRYDYIILGDASRPGSIDKVIFSARQGGGQGTAVASGPPMQRPMNQPPSAQQQVQPEEPESDSEDFTAPENEQPAQDEQQGQPQPGQPQQMQPGQPVYPQMNPQQNAPEQNSPDQQEQNRVKSPEQLLRELQQMQQQQQQQQQQPNQNPQ